MLEFLTNEGKKESEKDLKLIKGLTLKEFTPNPPSEFVTLDSSNWEPVS